jgi:hypothetical protein
MATTGREDAARAALEQSQQRVAAGRAVYNDLMQGWPTPEQAELDQIKMGIHLRNKADTDRPEAIEFAIGFGYGGTKVETRAGAAGQPRARAPAPTTRQPPPQMQPRPPGT